MDVKNVYYSREEIDRALDELAKSCKVPNVLLLGRMASGKSSVADYVFGGTGAARPTETEGIFMRTDGGDVRLFDSTGGVSDRGRWESLVVDGFLVPRASLPPEQSVHAVWFCSDGGPSDDDVRFVSRIRGAGFPAALLLTKIDLRPRDEVDALVSGILRLLPDVPVFRLSVRDREVPGLRKSTQWDELISWTHGVIPQVCKERFTAALREGLDLKRRQARIAVAAATSAAAAVGASPIPFSDAAILVPVQTAMVTSILTIYGVEMSKGAISGFVGSTTISALGRSVAGNLAKLIPAVGTVVGAVINAGVAASFTGALGEALTELLYADAKAVVSGKKDALTVEEIFAGGILMDAVKQFMRMKKKPAVESRELATERRPEFL